MHKGLFCKTLTTLVLVALALGTTFAANSSLPGGTSIVVTIDSPGDGTEIVLPPDQETVDVVVTGQASIGEGDASANTTLIYVLDASGSTEGTAGAICPDQNPIDADPFDPVPDENEIIDCEIGAAINLNDVAISLGTIDRVAMIIFAGDAVTADATPGVGDVALIAPSADANANAVNDVNEVLHSIMVAEYVGDAGRFNEFAIKPIPDLMMTDYADAIRKAGDVAQLAATSNVIVIFVSDGENRAGDHVSDVLPISLPGKNVVFHTFSIPSAGSPADCSMDPRDRGSLQDIADLTGGTCTEVEDPSQLPDVLPKAIIPTLNTLEMAVDGGSATPIDNAEVDPDLPQDGPMTVTYHTTVSGLGFGEHEICVTAHGSDAGGSGDVTECVTVRVVSPSTAVELRTFAAQAGSDQVTLTWETASELDNEGFNLWRSQAADGGYARINIALIPAEGSADTGASYSYTDADVVRGALYYYRLEDIDIHGVSAFHGPIWAMPGERRVYLPFIIQ